MKRRSFLQAIAGFMGAAIVPNTTAKALEKIKVSGMYGYLPCDKSIISKKKYDKLFISILTIDDFGAKETKLLKHSGLSSVIRHLTWHEPSDIFPNVAEEGYAFYFTPKTYQGLPLDENTISRLEGCYIFNGYKWGQLLPLSNNACEEI
jgi:hypothetical protein